MKTNAPSFRISAICGLITILSSLMPARASDNPLDLSQVIGLTVNVQDSRNCGGSNSDAQTVTQHASITGGDKKCPPKLSITVIGSVETQNAPFDFVYVNDILFFSGDENNTRCTMTTKTVTKQVTVDPEEGITLTYATSDGLYHTGAYATITDAVVVEGGCTSGCEPGGGAFENGSIHASMNLGRAEFGQAVGALSIVESIPSAVLGTPASLRFSNAFNSVEVIRDANDAIRQVSAPQCFADVVTETADRFRVDFYDAANVGPLSGGLHDQTGKTRYVRWIFDNIDTASNTHLKITKQQGTSSVVTEFIWSATAQGWELIEGNGQRKEIKSTIIDTIAQTRTVTVLVKNSADQLVSKRVDTYKDFSWGRELIQSVTDPDGAALATTYTFYENLATDGGAYSKLKLETRPGGDWARYEYNAVGRRTKTIEPFLDSTPSSAESLCKVTTVAYQDAIPQETRIDTILGQEVGRSYKSNSNNYQHITQDIVCTVPGAAYDASSNLITSTKLVSYDPFLGEISSHQNSDGTGQTYSYFKTATEKTTYVRSGQMSNGSVSSGTSTTAITDIAGNLIAETVSDIESGLTLSITTVTAHDVFGRPTAIDYNDGTMEAISYGCCGIDSRTDREGITTSYTYDAFKRVLSETRAGITTSYTYNAEGQILTRKRTGSDNSQILQETNTYDIAGRLVTNADGFSQTTTHAYSTDTSGRAVETTTFPNGSTAGTVSYKDGKPFTHSGTATPPRKWIYGVEPAVGYYEQEILFGTAASENEWTKTWQDHVGRTIKTQHAGCAPATFTYDPFGRVIKSTDPDGVIILTAYDGQGRIVSRALDVDRSNSISTPDQVQLTAHQILSAHGTIVSRTETRVINPAGVEELISQSDTSTDRRSQWTTRIGLISSSALTYGSPGTRTEVITLPDNSTQTLTYSQGRLTSQITRASGGTPTLKSLTHTYDPHGRLLTTTDARNGTTTYGYDALDRLTSTSTTTPTPSSGLASMSTTQQYDSMGHLTVLTLPDSSQTQHEYFLTGNLKKTSGSQTPTLERTYDPQGRMISLTTTGQAGPAITTWTYHSATGRLTGKSYPGGDTLAFTYTDAGRPLTRASGRGITRTNLYDNGGRQTGIDYSDSTPDVTYTLNRLGQIIATTDAGGTRSHTLTSAGQPLTESYTSGLLIGAATTRTYDSLLRPQSVSTTSTPSGPAIAIGYTYDTASRLQTVTAGAEISTYTYQPDSTLFDTLTTRHSGIVSKSTTTAFDHLSRFTSILTTNGTTTVSSHAYTYNTLGQRTESVLEDASKWNYQYDAMGQVIQANATGPAAPPSAARNSPTPMTALAIAPPPTLTDATPATP